VPGCVRSWGWMRGLRSSAVAPGRRTSMP
jgi:hypothetical protein